jgi:hypothetical protein
MSFLATPKRLKTHQGLSAAHRHAPKHEAATAKRLGGTVTAGSGNKHEKGDVRIRGVLRAELKCTTRNSFSVTRDILQKVEAAAAANKEIPAMEIQFLDKEGTILDTFAVVPRWVLDLIVQERRASQ